MSVFVNWTDFTGQEKFSVRVPRTDQRKLCRKESKGRLMDGWNSPSGRPRSEKKKHFNKKEYSELLNKDKSYEKGLSLTRKRRESDLGLSLQLLHESTSGPLASVHIPSFRVFPVKPSFHVPL